MAKYKIVHLITSLKIGGAETILYDIVKNLDSKLFESTVVYFYDGPNVEKLKDLGIHVHKIKGLICKYDPIFFFKLLFLIKKIKPNCIHSSLWSANVLGSIISYILKIPIACALHLATNFESNAKNTFFRNLIDKLVLKIPKKIIIVSNSMLVDLKKNINIPLNKLEIIQNGIDVTQILNQSKLTTFNRQNYNITKESFLIGSVGRFVERKNHKLLIDSFALLKNKYDQVKLLLCGYGPLEDFLKSQIKKLNITEDVIFIKTDQPFGLYPLFDCFVLSSNCESFGLVTLEAMAFKLPCIVCNPTENHEIIKDGINGYLSKPNDIIDLYSKIEKVYKNKNQAKKIGLTGYKYLLKNFNIKKMVDQYSKLFITICEK